MLFYGVFKSTDIHSNNIIFQVTGNTPSKTAGQKRKAETSSESQRGRGKKRKT